MTNTVIRCGQLFNKHHLSSIQYNALVNKGTYAYFLQLLVEHGWVKLDDRCYWKPYNNRNDNIDHEFILTFKDINVANFYHSNTLLLRYSRLCDVINSFKGNIDGLRNLVQIRQYYRLNHDNINKDDNDYEAFIKLRK